MKAFLRKTSGGLLMADNDETADFLDKKKVGAIIMANISEPRNGKFLAKSMTMFEMIHDQLPEPEEVEFRGRMVTPSHSTTSTRKYLTVMAGYYEIIGLPNGKIKYEPLSLSFDKMDEETFRKFYSDVIDAALKIMPDSWSNRQIKEFENMMMQYI